MVADVCSRHENIYRYNSAACAVDVFPISRQCLLCGPDGHMCGVQPLLRLVGGDLSLARSCPAEGWGIVTPSIPMHYSDGFKHSLISVCMRVPIAPSLDPPPLPRSLCILGLQQQRLYVVGLLIDNVCLPVGEIGDPVLDLLQNGGHSAAVHRQGDCQDPLRHQRDGIWVCPVIYKRRGMKNSIQDYRLDRLF